MWICNSCKKENKDEGDFCSFCGKKRIVPEQVAANGAKNAGMLCPECGAWIRAGVTVCPECGANTTVNGETVACPACGKAVPSDADTCPYCGEELLVDLEMDGDEKNRRLLPVIIGILCIVAVLLVVLLCMYSCNRKGQEKPVATVAPVLTEAPVTTKAPSVTAEPVTESTPEPTTVSTTVPTVEPTATPKPTATPYVNYFLFAGEEVLKGAESVIVQRDKNTLLYITRQEMEDLVRYCPGLETLKLDFCYMDDYSLIGEFEDLKKLQLTSCNGNKVEDISWISNLRGLTELNLCYNAIDDLTPLEGLKKVTWLNLGDNPLDSLASRHISKMTALRTLYLYSTGIQNLYGLEQLKKLTHLSVRYDSKVKMLPDDDLPGGKNVYGLNNVCYELPNLKILQMTGVEVYDFSCLEDSIVEEIWMENIVIRNGDQKAVIDSLANMVKLKTIYISKKDKNFTEAELKAALPGVTIKTR